MFPFQIKGSRGGVSEVCTIQLAAIRRAHGHLVLTSGVTPFGRILTDSEIVHTGDPHSRGNLRRADGSHYHFWENVQANAHEEFVSFTYSCLVDIFVVSSWGCQAATRRMRGCKDRVPTTKTRGRAILRSHKVESSTLRCSQGCQRRTCSGRSTGPAGKRPGGSRLYIDGSLTLRRRQ